AMIDQRRANVRALYSSLKTSALRLVYPTDWEGWVPMAVPAFVDGRDRALFVKQAWDRGVWLRSLVRRLNHLTVKNRGDFQNEQNYLDRHILIPINENISGARMQQLIGELNAL